MLIGKSRSNPNNTSRLKCGGVSQYLPKVAVIGFLKLIFDQNMRTAKNILANDVRRVRSDSNFLTNQFQLQPQLRRKYCKVV